MDTALDHTVSIIGLRSTVSYARSALPHAPIVPESGFESLVIRARRAVAIALRRTARPAPALSGEPAGSPG